MKTQRNSAKKASLIVVFFLVVLSGLLISQDYGNRCIISIQKEPSILQKIKCIPLDYLMEQDGKIYIVASAADLQRLRVEGIPFHFEPEQYPNSPPETFVSQSSINGAYHSYRELELELMNLARKYPGIAKVVDIGDSLEGRNIYALKISGDVDQHQKEPRIIILGCHHAREWISVEIPLLLGQHLTAHYATDPKLRQLVNRSAIWIIPLVNPDGLEYTIHFYRYWRKNRRDNGGGSYGVDPNRNYGYKWGYDDIGSSTNPNSATYRGEAPFSEPETQAIRNLFKEHSFQALVSYHSYSQTILYPWGYKKDPSQDENLMADLAKRMADLMRPVNGRSYSVQRAGAEFYLTNGDTTDWAYGIYHIPAFTIELPPVDQVHGGFFNAEKDIQSLFNENLPALLYLIDWSIANWKGNTGSPSKTVPPHLPTAPKNAGKKHP